MPKRCNHQNLTYTEETQALCPWRQVNGVLYKDYNDFGEIRYVSVECDDCGFKHRYDLDARSTPKWVWNIFTRIQDKEYFNTDKRWEADET